MSIMYVCLKSPDTLDRQIWTHKMCKEQHSSKYGMLLDKINKEKDKLKIDMYAANLDLFFAAMSDINELSSIIFENCLKMKYLTLFRAYNLNELEDCASQ